MKKAPFLKKIERSKTPIVMGLKKMSGKERPLLLKREERE
jgi:hypothetical protein